MGKENLSPTPPPPQKTSMILLQYSAQRLSLLEHDIPAETWTVLPVLSPRTGGSIPFSQFHTFYNWLFSRGTRRCCSPTTAAVWALPLSLRSQHGRKKTARWWISASGLRLCFQQDELFSAGVLSGQKWLASMSRYEHSSRSVEGCATHPEQSCRSMCAVLW